MHSSRLIFCLVLLLGLWGCGGGGGAAGSNPNQSDLLVDLSKVALQPGESRVAVVTGGVAPYAVSSSNRSVALASIDGRKVTVGGILAGTADVLISDRNGKSVPIAVTVQAAQPLSTDAVAPLVVPVGLATARTFNVRGGLPPYAVSVSDPRVAAATVLGSTVTVTGLAASLTTLNVTDAIGSPPVAVQVSVVGNIAPLFTTASGGVTLQAGTSSTAYTVGGGSAPYTAVSNNPGVATATVLGGQLTINAISVGTATLTVRDAAGGSVTAQITVSSVALTSDAPVNFSLQSGPSNARAFTLFGGTTPYTVAVGDPRVLSATVTGNRLSITGLNLGPSSITIRDAGGGVLTLQATVVGNVVPLFTTASGGVTLQIGTSSTAYTVGGGTTPYTVASNNTGVATATLVGGQLTISAISAGNATLTVRDADGVSVSFAVTVASQAAAPLFSTAGAAVTLKPGTTATYALGGGVPPYSVFGSSAPSVATASITGSVLSINALAAGTAQLIIMDSANSAPLTISVTASYPPLSVNPAALTGNVSDTVFFVVSGGATPYRFVSTNEAIVKAPTLVSQTSTEAVYSATLLLTGSASFQVIDAAGTSQAVPVTVSNDARSFRLSPSELAISENFNAPFTLQIVGGTAPYTAFTTDVTRTSVPAGAISTSSLSVGLGTSGNRCVATTAQVTITLIDGTGQAATSTITITDNNGNPCP